ncbi:RNA pol II accessory factor, Cdc73 family-domain-containing protein [Myxozyma melibiosi]|uniref:RNA pol II accessory factor, Cdc73 family-domain-containing protein n=1 Tax=Myxozyma melibiosi TaxID=54550 RepID=A0ABR1FC63_9ASCO
MDSLLLLRRTLSAGKEPALLAADGSAATDIADAAQLSFADQDQPTAIDLATPTRFVRQRAQVGEAGPVDLRGVYFAWLCRDQNVASYLTACQEKNIANLTFVERTSLITWLQGADDHSEFIVSEKQAQAKDKAEAGKPAAAAKTPLDPRLTETYANERVLQDHNSVLDGVKPTSFEYVRKEAVTNFLQPARERAAGASRRPTAAASNGSSSAAAAVSNPARKQRREPIILLSPSASALLTMTNVKDFLERGVFSSAPTTASGESIQTISRASARIGQLRFLVVDSVDRFKPDYWERVVAVFTTGQTWQFRSYPNGLNNPNLLFQKVKGFCLNYAGDPLPDNIRSWNVDVVQIDKVHRFRDRETVEGLWDSLEKWMEARGWSGRGVQS